MIKHSKLCIYVCLKCNLYVDITTKISDNHEICRGKKNPCNFTYDNFDRYA